MLFIYLAAIACYLAVSIYLTWWLTRYQSGSDNTASISPSLTSAFLKPNTLTQDVPSNRFTSKFITLGLATTGIMAHAVILYPQIVTLHGLNFNVFNVTSLITLFFLLFYVLFCLYRPVLSLGILAAPLGVIGVSLGYFGVAPYSPLTHIGHGLEVHIILSLAAYCVLLMAAVQAVIMRFQIRELKHKTIHRFWVNNLPSLQSMESLLFDMILIGFILLSIALAIGLIYVEDLLTQHLIHKTVFSLFSWLLFGALLVGHWRSGWRGKRAANITIVAFIFLALGFIGTKVVLELII